MSGHGNSEEYRDWHEVEFDASGKPSCPAPSPDYLPSCWRAGEIIEARCQRSRPRRRGVREARRGGARQNYVDAGIAGHRAVPGVLAEDWLDSGQCRDCFLPAFNYRPGGSSPVRARDHELRRPRRNPQQLPLRLHRVERQPPGAAGHRLQGVRPPRQHGGARVAIEREVARAPARRAEEAPDPQSRAVDLAAARQGLGAVEAERQASFFMTGGLAAVHADGRSRDAVWNALERKEVYGDQRRSHPALVPPAERAGARAGGVGAVPMGGEVRMAARRASRCVPSARRSRSPAVRTSASRRSMRARIEALCLGECFNPSDERKLITRIEVVRIRPQARGRRAGRAACIEDPWRVFPCEPSQAGCVVQFEDPEFAAAARPAVYYVRAIEEPTPTVNAENLRCETDEHGQLREGEPLLRRLPTPRSTTTASRERRARLVVADLRRSA